MKNRKSDSYTAEEAKIRRQQEKLYNSDVIAQLKKSITSGKALQELKIKIAKENKPIDLIDLYRGIQLECDTKYMKPADKSLKNRFFDVGKFDSKLKEIEDDERVLFIFKRAIFWTVDLYFDLIIISDFLNTVFEYKKGHTKTNVIHFILEKALTDQNKKKIIDPLKRIEYEALYGNLKRLFENLMQKVIGKGFDNEEKILIEKAVLKMASGDILKVEKLLFPLILDYVVLNDEIMLQKKFPSTKKELLYNLFPIIKPDFTFLTATEFEKKNTGNKRYYSGSYYKYKADTITTLLGKPTSGGFT
jgi:hypothetical protein